MFTWLGSIGSILLVDLALSGDNALVIGAVASKLHGRERWWALLLGGSGALILRILFAITATYMLQLALLQAIGGAILLFIAIRLLGERSDRRSAATPRHDQQEGTSKKRFLKTLLSILFADTTMSLDNILAVGALAEGNVPVLVTGILISIITLLIGSALISGLMGHLPWLLDLASLVLAWTASHMILTDMQLGPLLTRYVPAASLLIPTTALLIVLLYDLRQWYLMKDEHPLVLKIRQRFRRSRRRY